MIVTRAHYWFDTQQNHFHPVATHYDAFANRNRGICYYLVYQNTVLCEKKIVAQCIFQTQGSC